MNALKLIAVGDISLQTKSNKSSFENVRKVFQSKDILFGNLETVLSTHGKEAEKAVVLHTSPDKVSYLKEAGFDILNLANNHIMDLGPEGFNETLEVLNQNDLIFIGISNHKFTQSWAVVEKNDIKLGFLGYKSGRFRRQNSIFINCINESRILNDINKIKPQCDAIIVSLHWGVEKVFYPSPQQVKLARKLIDSGATIILGHHPHVVQAIEKYKNGLIAYSLGNFQFQFTPGECHAKNTKRTNQSIILSFEVGRDGVRSYDIIPVKINHDFCPYIPCEEEQEKMHDFISSISFPIKNDKLTWGWWYENIADEYLSGNMESCIIRIKKYGIKHLIEFIRWLISPFCLKCYATIVRKKIRVLLSRK